MGNQSEEVLPHVCGKSSTKSTNQCGGSDSEVAPITKVFSPTVRHLSEPPAPADSLPPNEAQIDPQGLGSDGDAVIRPAAMSNSRNSSSFAGLLPAANASAIGQSPPL